MEKEDDRKIGTNDKKIQLIFKTEKIGTNDKKIQLIFKTEKIGTNDKKYKFYLSLFARKMRLFGTKKRKNSF
jgi:hypothetical protein